MEECPICFDDLENDIFETKCCKKNLHTKCFNLCTQESHRCPFCRSETIETMKTNTINFDIIELYRIRICLVCSSILFLLNVICYIYNQQILYPN